MSRKIGTGINIGSISILIIFVLLCLTTFATLSLVSANADAKLSNTAADSLSDYYLADARAEEILANIDSKLKDVSFNKTKQQYFNDCITSLSKLSNISTNIENEKLTINYNIKIDDKNELNVALSVVYPKKSDDKLYRILKWKSVHTEQEIVEETLNLWDNNENNDI